MTNPHYSDKQLIAQCRAGDQHASEVLVRRHISGLYDVCFRMLRSRADAEDAVQEAFAAAFARLSDFRGDAAFATWLYRIGANKALDIARKRDSRGPSVAYSSELHDRAAKPHEPLHADTHGDPEREVLRQLDTERLWKAVHSLPPKYRMALILFYRQGLSYKEIGEVLKLPQRTVETRLYRARQQLRELYTATMGAERP